MSSTPESQSICMDLYMAMYNPPSSAIKRELLFSRLRSSSVRIQYISWNICGIILLYSFPDSLLNQYLIYNKGYFNILFHLLQLIAFVSYFITSCMDPGYIPLALNNPILSLNERNPNVEDSEYIDYTDSYEKSVSEWNKMILIDPEEPPTNFCWNCKYIRPIRSKHCYDCGRCVGKFDHHCPMIGNCIGGKNHRYFLLFLINSTIIVTWTFYILLNTLIKVDLIYDINNQSLKGQHNNDRSITGWIIRIIFFFCTLFALFISSGLTVFHIYLSVSNKTTYEMLKPGINYAAKRDQLLRKRNYFELRSISSYSDSILDEDYDRIKTISFDEGFINNWSLFWTGRLKSEWQLPFLCILKDDEDEHDDDDDNDVSIGHRSSY